MNDEEEEEDSEPGHKRTRKEAEAVDLDAGEDLTPEGEEEEEQELLDEEAEALDEDVPYSEGGGRFEEEEAATARKRADAIGGIPAGRRKRTGQKKAGGDVGPIADEDESGLGDGDFENEKADEGEVSARTGRSSNPVEEADVEELVEKEDREEQRALPRSRQGSSPRKRASRRPRGRKAKTGKTARR